jgi:hypothetical protein
LVQPGAQGDRGASSVRILVSTADNEQAVALQVVGEYLALAGMQAATALLGCPPVDRDTTRLAEISNSLLTSAALCAGLVEMAEEVQNAE